MISIVKGKTEISLNLQGGLFPRIPLPLRGAEAKDRSAADRIFCLNIFHYLHLFLVVFIDNLSSVRKKGVKYKKLEIYELLEFLFAIYPNENPKK